MKKIKFTFYSVLKNEDAIPYVGDNLLVVADGLGGAGSETHKIDRQKHPDIRGDIWSSAFGDIKEVTTGFKDYVDELIAPMLDNNDDTSALWASRIVIARCVYALTEGEFQNADLENEGERARLVDFIARGLRNVAEKFELQNGKYSGQRLLPTTLALIRFSEQKGKIIAETVWAGDSRCYALTTSGQTPSMKVLSVDDEDNSGSITNLFYADNQKTHLNYLRHTIDSPCVLMAVSDGVFDPFSPYDHMGMEYSLLKTISESNSEQDLSAGLKSLFDSIHGDDATMAFVSLGFSNFIELKNELKTRIDDIVSVMHRKAELRIALEAINLSEQDVTYYVTNRTTDKFEYIVSMLLDAINHEQDDIAITDEIREVVESTKTKLSEENEQNRESRRKKSLDALFKYVQNHPELVNNILANGDMRFGEPELSKAVSSFKNSATKLVKQQQDAVQNGEERKESMESKPALLKRCRGKIDFYRRELDKMVDPSNDNVSDKQYFGLLNILNQIYQAMIVLIKAPHNNNSRVKFSPGDACWERTDNQELAWDIQDYCDCKKGEMEDNKRISEAQRKYLESWNTLFQWIATNPPYELILSEKIRQEFGFDNPLANEPLDKKVVQDKVLQSLRAQKATVVAGIVNMLAKYYDKTSIIDRQFNADRLSLFRTFYKLKYQPNNDIAAFNEQLNVLESDYISLITQCKKTV